MSRVGVRMQGRKMINKNKMRSALMQVKTRNAEAHHAQRSESEERRYRKVPNSCILERGGLKHIWI